MLKACRVCVGVEGFKGVCGCRRLVGCGWVLKELQIVILCNHSIFHQLNNILICRCTCTKSYKVLHSCCDSEGLHFRETK